MYVGGCVSDDVVVDVVIVVIIAVVVDDACGSVCSSALLVLCGDHGEAFGEHSGYDKHGNSVFEEAVHVPLLIAGPKLPQVLLLLVVLLLVM